MSLGVLLVTIIFGYFLFKFIIFSIKHAKKRNSFSHFPQLPTNFFLGETSILKKRPITHHIIQRLNEIADYIFIKDRIFITWMSIIPTVFIYNKDYVKQILSKNEPDFLNKGEWLYKGLNDFAPNSLLTITGDQWKARRKILSQPFHTTNLDNFVKITNFEAKRLINYLKNNQCKDIMYEAKKLGLIIFCKLLFEYDVSEEIERTVALTDKTIEILLKKAFSIYMISPALYRFTSLASEENDLCKDLMSFKNEMLNAKAESSRKNLKSKLEFNMDVNSKANTLTLIEILLKNFKNVINEKTSEWAKFDGFTMDEIKAQLDTFIVAGSDTQSNAFTFLFYHLAQNQNFQEQIYQEIQQVVSNSDSKHEFTMEEIKKLTFLEAFINESLRMRPIVPVIVRALDNDITFDEKYKIPAGTDIVIFIERVLNDPEYFPEPNVFKPSRWLLENQTDNLYVNIPFSGGVRNCVAKRVALYILRLVAANIVRHYKIEFTESTPKELTASMIKYEFVNKPIDPIELKFTERKH